MFQPDRLADLIQEDRCAGPKYEPGTLQHLITWLETKPADEEYCFNGDGDCLWDQYGKYLLRYTRPNVGRATAYCHAVNLACQVNGWSVTDPHRIGPTKPHAFGAALTRALAATERLS